MKKLIIMLQVLMISNFISLAQDQEMGLVIIKIKTTAQCNQCKERIESAMAFERGVKSSVLEIDTKILTVTYKKGKTTDEKIRVAITKLGYDADNLKKDEKSYKKLPACCKMPDDKDYVGH